jgi:hypothetical protein
MREDRQSSARLLLTAALVASIVFAAAVILWWPSTDVEPQRSSRGDPPSSDREAAQPPRAAAASRIGPSGTSGQVVRTSPRKRQRPAAPDSAAPDSSEPHREGRSAERLSEPAAASTAPSPSSRTARNAAVEGGIAAEIVYDPSDPDVVPPALVEPGVLRMSSPISTGIRIEAMRIALIVDRDGTVESARPVVSPQNLGEALVLSQALSAAKAWRFHPATRNGRPVKFRHVVAFTVAPG